MLNKCGDCAYHGCPASFYLQCTGFTTGGNCWELPEKPCCSNTELSVCQRCRVYLACHEQKAL